jgi:hypothetical protein
MKEIVRLIKEYDLFHDYGPDDIHLLERNEKWLVHNLDDKDKLIVANIESSLDLAWRSYKQALESVRLRVGKTKYEKTYSQNLYNKYSDLNTHVCGLLEDFITDGGFVDFEKWDKLIFERTTSDDWY